MPKAVAHVVCHENRRSPSTTFFAWCDSDGRRARSGADHGRQILALAVFHPVGVVDPVIDRSFNRLEGDFPCHARCNDPSGLLTNRGLIPAGFLTMITTHIERTIDHDLPDPSWGAIGDTVLAKRCDLQIVDLIDLRKLVLGPCHCRPLLVAHQFDRDLHGARTGEHVCTSVDDTEPDETGGVSEI